MKHASTAGLRGPPLVAMGDTGMVDISGNEDEGRERQSMTRTGHDSDGAGNWQ